jgi:hypothetical protein
LRQSGLPIATQLARRSSSTPKRTIEGDLLYKLRDDHNPLPAGAPL